MDNGNYIKISRKILEWEWYTNINTKVLFIHMLLRANWKDLRFEGNVIPRGSFISSIGKLADETKLTIREIRTAISHLESTGELTIKRHSKYSVFTINNYNLYQTIDNQIDNQETSKRHSNDILMTTSKEYKEGNIKETHKCVKKRFVAPTLKEVSAYCAERNNTVDPQSFIDFYTAKDWMIGKNRMKDWKAAVRTWERSNASKTKNQFNNFTQTKFDAKLDELDKLLLDEVNGGLVKR